MNNVIQGRLLGIAGKMGAGKSTVGKILEETGLWERTRFAQDLKAITFGILRRAGYSETIAHEIVDGSLKQVNCPSLGTSGRRFMQLIGSEFVRGFGCPNFWVNSSMLRAGKKRLQGKNIFFDDLRFRDTENVRIHQEKGLALYIQRDNISFDNSSSLREIKLIEEISATPINRHFRNNFVDICTDVFVNYWEGVARDVGLSVEEYISGVISIEGQTWEKFLSYYRDVFLKMFLDSVMDVVVPQASVSGHISENLYSEKDADFVIRNNGDMAELRRSVIDCLAFQDISVLEEHLAQQK